VHEINCGDTPRHVELLVTSVAEGCKKLGWTYDSISVFACGVGPGSFTGIRVGLAAVKGFGAATTARAFGIISLDIIAQGLPSDTDGLVFVDARRDTLYMGKYRSRQGVLKRVGALRLMTVTEAAAFLAASKIPCTITGDALMRYGTILQEAGGAAHRFCDESLWYPRGAYCAACACIYRPPNARDDSRTLVPRYISLSCAAEVKRRAQAQKRSRKK